MNIDAPLSQTPVAPAPAPQPPRERAEQASARPVERPHHDEPIRERPAPRTAPTARSDSQAAAAAPQTSTPRPPSELKPEQKHSAEAHAPDTSNPDNRAAAHGGGFGPDPTRSAPVGSLLDVLA